MASLGRNDRAQFAFPSDEAHPFDFIAERNALCLRAAARNAEDQIVFSRAVASSVTVRYWARVCSASGSHMPIRLGPMPSVDIPAEKFGAFADACAALDPSVGFYQIGELYTSLLPDEYRTRHGIYYTPPQLVTRLLDVVEAQGIDWANARVLDPACGGAAFAAYAAQRMLAANAFLSPEDRLRDLSERLVGFDIDPFATWLAAVFLDVICLPILREANRRIDGMIRLGDTLAQDPNELGHFDLVVGNPPYGKLTLSPGHRQRFSRSLYGHANIYGVFTDLAVTLTKPKGLIGFVTPTSFLGGEYFKNLRDLLVTETTPVHATFVSDREGVFSNVLQETMLTVYRHASLPRGKRRSKNSISLTVETIHPHWNQKVDVESFGVVSAAVEKGAPWILPRSFQQLALVRRLSRMPTRLADYGYRVATGQLVWNRHKAQFRDRRGPDCYPVLWAECIQPDGSFAFRADNRNHRPFIHAEPQQDYLINQEPCVLVQRTTSKEQTRRLVAATVPNSFILDHPGYVVENHVNMLIPTKARCAVSLTVLTRLINSETVDHAFRCISGSVAVSAYELENLPLPELDKLLRCASLTRSATGRRFEEVVRALYHDAR